MIGCGAFGWMNPANVSVFNYFECIWLIGKIPLWQLWITSAIWEIIDLCGANLKFFNVKSKTE